jgi:hypothetical protein
VDSAILRDPHLLAPLAERLDGSNDPDTLLERDLARYYGLLARELAAVQLNKLEAQVIEVARRAAEQARIAGRPFGSFAAAVAAEIERTRDLDLRARWALDGDALIAKAAAWTPGQTLAVLDACERVRAAAHRGGETSLAELLAAAGLPREHPDALLAKSS